MDLRSKRIVVTGGAGLIGSFVTERLVAAGAHVVVADDFSKGRRSYLQDVSSNIEIREGDLENPAFFDLALDQAEVVFHLASRAHGIGYSAGNHLTILEHNERVTSNLLSALRRRPVQHLLIASSSCVYPDDGPDTIPELPIFEREPELANLGYGWSKRFLEQKALLYARETGLRITIARPFNIYGERYTWLGDKSQAIPMLVKKVVDGQDPVVIWGSGRQRRNYLHSIDCAEAMVGLVEAGWIDGPVNIGTEDTVTMFELIEAICKVAGRQPKIVCDASKPEGRSIKSADSTRLRQALPGFLPSISLEAGLRRMLGWYNMNFAGSTVSA